MKNNLSFSSTEIAITIITTILGVSLLTLPKNLAVTLGSSDGWVSILISGMAILLLATIYIKYVQNYFSSMSLLEVLEQTRVGSFFSKVFCVFLVIYFILLISILIRYLGIIIKLYLIPQTPSEIIIGLAVLVIAYMASKGVQGVVYLNLIFFPITFIVLFLMVILNINNFNFSYLQPFFAGGIKPIVIGIKETSLSFLGIELIFFLMAYIKKDKIELKKINLSIIMVTFVYTIITLFTYGIFTVDTTKTLLFPTVEMAKEIQLEVGVFERLESFLITIWSLTMFNTFSVFFILLLDVIKNHLVKNKSFNITPVLIALIFWISFIPKNVNELGNFSNWVSQSGGVLIIVLFLFSIIQTYIIKSRQRRN
ncbi:spore germination protein YndE [Paraliobacillus quinghaiensis]|uniref:Spore germination protein YndE n=1 Tax=Paraliobacillus quinghaiensis TaxID=470815 RepID=A0A917TIF2_9BACI|nr:GerAB/ArcD/ProY family transporter [Paraliobacillus quinghaiensis]GGM23729.1 spore germination protein YndE [Paraliobacillus quinghaiensis]